MRHINKVIIHCSDSDHKHHDDISVIRRWHVEENRWTDIGYHYFIKKNGQVQEGRPLSRFGAHAKGYNHESIGICLHGRNNFTKEQFASMNKLCSLLMCDFNLTDSNFFGHNDVSDKTCPNFDVKKKLSLQECSLIQLPKIVKELNITTPKI